MTLEKAIVDLRMRGHAYVPHMVRREIDRAVDGFRHLIDYQRNPEVWGVKDEMDGDLRLGWTIKDPEENLPRRQYFHYHPALFKDLWLKRSREITTDEFRWLRELRDLWETSLQLSKFLLQVMDAQPTKYRLIESVQETEKLGTKHILRIAKYHPSLFQKTLVTPPHSDRSLLSLYLWESTPQFLVSSQETNALQSLALLPNHAFVLPGRKLEVATNAAYHATKHSAQIDTETERWVVAFFIHSAHKLPESTPMSMSNLLEGFS